MTRRTIACGIDSQTDTDAGYGVPADLCWPSLLARTLNAEGCNVRSRNFGLSGDTSTQALARFSSFFRYDVPTMGVLFGCPNDPSNGITSATTQANVQAMVQALKFGARGDGLVSGATVAGQSNLPSTGEPGQRYVVLSDTSTTGGAAAWSPAHMPTVTGTKAGVTTWEYRYGAAGELGWGRVAVAGQAPTVVKKIVIVGTNYKNYATDGSGSTAANASGRRDTTATPEPFYLAVRQAMQAAVTAEAVSVAGVPTVVYADLYALQRSRIVAGTDPDFSGGTAYDQTRSWHIFDGNQHHDAYGHALVAQAVRTAMPAGWLADLV